MPTDDVTIGTVNRLTNALARFRRAKALTTAKGKEPTVHLTEFAYFASGSLALPARHSRQVHHAGVRDRPHEPEGRPQLLYFGLLQTPDRQWNTGLLRPDGKPDDSFTSLKAWVERQRRAGLLQPAS